MKKLIMIITLAFCFVGATAQEWGTLEAILGRPSSSPKSAEVVDKNDEVTLVVSSDGATKEEATKFALRSAIEQAFGTFVSANTTVLNDELVKEEIATVSSGNIKSYNEVASVTFPNGRTSVTLNATVCISKLVSYSKSKGSAAEFAGATFAQNMKSKELNRQNEVIALKNLYKQVREMLPGSYYKKLTIGEPRVSKRKEGFYELPIKVKITSTERENEIFSIISFTLKNLRLTKEEVKEYKDLNLPLAVCEFLFKEEYFKAVFRNTYSCEILKKIKILMSSEASRFVLIGNLLDKHINDIYRESYDYFDNHGRKVSAGGGEEDAYRLRENIYYDDVYYDKDMSRREDFIFYPAPVRVCSGYLFIPVEDISKYSNFKIDRLELPDLEEVNKI